MKRIFISGSAHGIGAAIARTCAQSGYEVVGTDVDADGLRRLREELTGVHTAELDVRDVNAWERVASEVEREAGEIDVLINNAGICRPGRCDLVTREDDRSSVEVNLMGVIHGVRTFVPRFLERQSGHIINVASMAAFAPAPDLAVYCATKHAVRAYTHSCALDHRHAPIDWTLVCPGAVETPMLQRMREARAGAVVFTEQPIAPERVANAVVRAIESPRREVLVPSARGSLIRFLGLFPGLLSRGMDDAERRGLRTLDG